MIVSILQENLAHAISIVQRAVAARSTMPVLGCILFKAAGGALQPSATNPEFGIKHTAAAQVKKEGMVAIPARQLAAYVNALPPDRIDLELNAKTQTLRLKCANYQANLKGIDGDDFPAIPMYDKGDVALIEPESPGVLKPVGTDTFTYVLMPMHLKDMKKPI